MHDFRYVRGRLHCEGVSIESLTKKYGTPLYVYSSRTLTDHFQKLDAALAPLDRLICFAMKSNSNMGVMRTLADLGSGFDTDSGAMKSATHLHPTPPVCRVDVWCGAAPVRP